MIECNGLGVIRGHNDAIANLGHVVKCSGKAVRQANAAVRRAESWNHSGVQRDAGPSDALHVRHFSAGIDIALVADVLFQNGKHSRRRGESSPPGRHARRCDFAI